VTQKCDLPSLDRLDQSRAEHASAALETSESAWSKNCMAARPAVIDIGSVEKVPP
jgi:hypothetical protein